MRVLFLSWDGPGTTYHESLFIPILARTFDRHDDVTLLQYSWGAPERDERTAQLAASHGFTYEVRNVPARLRPLLVPLFLLAEMVRLAWRIRRHRYDMLLARSVVPGALAVAARAPLRSSPRFVYDADGLPAEERLEFAGWKRSSLRYRLYRYLDELAIRTADTVLVRTRQAAALCQERTGTPAAKFHVVINGKAPDAFRPLRREERRLVRDEIGVPVDAPLVVYVGSLGPQYLPDDMAAFVAEATNTLPETWFLVLTPRRHQAAMAKIAARHGLDQLVLREAGPGDVPRYVAAADLGLALRMPTTSQRAVAPIKVGEYLMCGVPVLYTSGVGDLDGLLGDESLGVELGADWRQAARWFEASVLPHRDAMGSRARQAGVDLFSLDRAASSYRAALENRPRSTPLLALTKEH